MTFETQLLDIQNGTDISEVRLQAMADQTSRWLSDGVPYTKPKSSDALICDAQDSYYAVCDGWLAGHIAVVEYKAANQLEAAYLHFGIGSLVVNPRMRGMGVGKLLVAHACDVITSVAESSTVDDPEAFERSIRVAAVAAPTSLKLFAAHGFTPVADTVHSIIGSAMNYDPTSGKTLVHKQISLQTSVG
jgi:GNAT superfamily N-acetyltransferase